MKCSTRTPLPLLEIPGHKSQSAQRNVVILCLLLLAWGVWCSKLKLIALVPTEGGGSCDFSKICVCVCQCELHYGRRDVWLPRQTWQVSSSQMRVLNSAKCVSGGFKDNKSDHGACTSSLPGTGMWWVSTAGAGMWSTTASCALGSKGNGKPLSEWWLNQQLWLKTEIRPSEHLENHLLFMQLLRSELMAAPFLLCMVSKRGIPSAPLSWGRFSSYLFG